MSRISRGRVLVAVAAIGAFAAGTGISVLLATGDTAKSERKVLAPAQAAPIASPTHGSPTEFAVKSAGVVIRIRVVVGSSLPNAGSVIPS